jgi:hypothetical protein
MTVLWILFDFMGRQRQRQAIFDELRRMPEDYIFPFFPHIGQFLLLEPEL